jgi:hypothetical protein
MRPLTEAQAAALCTALPRGFITHGEARWNVLMSLRRRGYLREHKKYQWRLMITVAGRAALNARKEHAHVKR